MKTKKLMVAVLLMLGLILAKNTNVFAIQSTSTGTSRRDTADNWITEIRRIEAENGGMGLKETRNATTALATSESNNIDVHLQKNTEYGAMVLLGASNYGKRATAVSAASCYMNNGSTATTGTVGGLATSTGNISGVYELGYYNMNVSKKDWEWTAGGGTSFLSSIDSRYRDIYTSQTGKPGDATQEGSINLASWHTSSPGDRWATGSIGFLRGIGDRGVFGRGSNNASVSYSARAVVVCGAGI